MRLSLSVLILTLSLAGRGEGEGSFSYQLALPGRKLTLPADHYSHPDFKTEWWYYTGHLESDSGKRYGYQVTFFRFGLRDRQGEVKERRRIFTDLYMAHFAVSDIIRKKFLFRERINRGYQEKAGRGDGSLPGLERGLESRGRWKRSPDPGERPGN